MEEPRMFVNCPGPLDEITFPETVKSIEYTAFYGCSKLTSITLKNGLVTLGNGAFAKCALLTNITIPKTVTIIDDNAFTNHEQITVCGINGSFAESYANAHGMQFKPIPDITEQPKSTSAALGKTVTFKVAAEGENLRYQWQYRKVGATSWTTWSGRTAASMKVVASETNNGCQYRCVVSNANGSVNSNAATLNTINP